MTKIEQHAKRLRVKLYRYFAILNIVLPADQMETIEKMIAEEFQDFEAHGAFFGREENNGNGNNNGKSQKT